ncbi:MAG: hypothetical protein K0R73_858 [Candidatus Midichloriaceae bacterium]|jgi:hypothetical protein|nr:hypothetical protein [Candidatus Midichloriaceae bacterium]
MNARYSISEIARNSLLRAMLVDIPIAAVVAPLDDPKVPMLGVMGLTLLGASTNYMIRSVNKMCGYPNIGSILGGSFYHSVIDGISLKSVFEGSARQLGYEFNLNYNPYINQIGGIIIPAIAIEAGQSLLENHTVYGGMLIGLYVGVATEGVYEPLIKYLNTPSSSNNIRRDII